MPESPNNPKSKSDTNIEAVQENESKINDEEIKDNEKPTQIEDSLRKSIEAYRNVRILSLIHI